MIFELKHEGNKGNRHFITWGKNGLGNGNFESEGLGWPSVWHVHRTRGPREQGEPKLSK